MSTFVHVDVTVQFTFFLVTKLNITIITSCDSKLLKFTLLKFALELQYLLISLSFPKNLSKNLRRFNFGQLPTQ